MSILDIQDKIANMKGVVTVVVNDGTRPSPCKLLADLRPVLTGRVRFLFATGTHRPVSVKEERLILGDEYAGKVVAESNMCDHGGYVHIGDTARGTEVEIHPWLLEGPVLALNSVEPHYFAGFTGGRKSFLPGTTSRKTVVQNHFLACLENAIVGKLSGNPVHEDMMEGAALLAERTEIIMINGVFGSDKVFCGSYDTSFYKAVELAEFQCGIKVERPYSSLEVRPGKSLEISLYQAIKAVFLWEKAVEDQGELVLDAECSEGLGARQMENILLASSGFFEVPVSAEEYSLGDHAVIRLKKIRSRINLTFRTEIDMGRFGFSTPSSSCETTIENAGFSFPVIGGTDA
ncbi:MAG: DUF2088 domain-containing protein [Candidatus Sabulitectum sp.]|nr:DUF2088 domain-containing protein [Candidatus Sabulitectum sp.]